MYGHREDLFRSSMTASAMQHMSSAGAQAHVSDEMTSVESLSGLLEQEINSCETMEVCLVECGCNEKAAMDEAVTYQREAEKVIQRRDHLEKMCKEIRRLCGLLVEETKGIRAEGEDKCRDLRTLERLPSSVGPSGAGLYWARKNHAATGVAANPLGAREGGVGKKSS